MIIKTQVDRNYCEHPRRYWKHCPYLIEPLHVPLLQGSIRMMPIMGIKEDYLSLRDEVIQIRHQLDGLWSMTSEILNILQKEQPKDRADKVKLADANILSDRSLKEKAIKDAFAEGYKKGKEDTEDALNVVTGEDAKRFYEATGLKPEDSL